MKLNQLAFVFFAFTITNNQYLHRCNAQQTPNDEQTQIEQYSSIHHYTTTTKAASTQNYNQQQGYVTRTYEGADDVVESLVDETKNDRKLGDIDLSSVLTNFKHTHELKDDAEFDFQVIDNSHTFSAKGKEYSLDGLEPVEVYTDDATLMMDGELVSDKLPHYNPHVFTRTDGSDTIILSTKEGGDGKQEIDTIDVMSADGSPDIHLATVLPGLLTTIRAEDMDIPDDIIIDFDDHDQDQDDSNDNYSSSEEYDKEFSAPGKASYYDDDIFRGRKLLRKSKKANRQLQSGCSSFEVIEMAIVFDSTFCARDGGGIFIIAKEKVEDIVARASVFYQRQGICGKVKISHLEGHCNAISDPYRNIVRNGDMSSGSSRNILGNFREFWRRNRTNISRDSAHLFFNERKDRVIGQAFINALCSNELGYGVNDMSISSSTFIKAVLFAHELGHNAGLSHTSGANSIMAGSLIRSSAPQWSSTSVSRLSLNLPRFTCLGTENNRPTPTPPTPPTSTPGVLTNYIFYPFMDSHGNDIKNQPGGIEVVARACSSDPRCKGFNSNGWMKHTVMDRSRWTRWTNDPSQGFYVKRQSGSPTPPTPTPPSQSPSGWMQLKTNGLCADLEDWRTAKNGMRIILKTCNSAAWSQQWNHDSLGRFVNRYTGKCMSVGRRGQLYDKAYIWSCSSSKVYYRWDKLSNGRYRNKGHRSYYLGIAYCGDKSKVGYLELRRLETSGKCGCTQTWNRSC